MKACPYRADFYKKLGDDKAKMDTQMTAWLDSLENIVNEMKTVYVTKGYGKVWGISKPASLEKIGDTYNNKIRVWLMSGISR